MAHTGAAYGGGLIHNMINRIVRISIPVIMGVALISSLIVNKNLSNTLLNDNEAILNDGITAAKGNLYVASDILNGGILQKEKHLGMADAAAYIGQAAGALTGIRTAAHYAGVDHVSGIAMELQQVSFQMTHPQHFASLIKADKSFVHVMERQLQASLTNGHFNKQRLIDGIPGIYAAMSPEDSRIFYNAT